MTPKSQEMQAALQLIGEGFNRPGWHGPNLLGSLRGAGLDDLLFRPNKDAHNAWELALHCAYWKYVTRNRLDPQARPPFPLAGANFFTRDERFDLAVWKQDRALLKRAHADLCATILSLKLAGLDRKLEASKHTYRRTLFGIAAHDIYHAGQISLLRKLAHG